MPNLSEFKNVDTDTHEMRWTDGDSRILLVRYGVGSYCEGRWNWQAHHGGLTASGIQPTCEEAHVAAEVALGVLRQAAVTVSEGIDRMLLARRAGLNASPT